MPPITLAPFTAAPAWTVPRTARQWTRLKQFPPPDGEAARRDPTPAERLYLPLEGELELLIGDGVWHVGPGQAAWVRPGIPATCLTPRDAPGRCLAVVAPNEGKPPARHAGERSPALVADLAPGLLFPEARFVRLEVLELA